MKTWWGTGLVLLAMSLFVAAPVQAAGEIALLESYVGNWQGEGALVFETDTQGRVTHWRAGVPPQVDYVEGCG